MSEAKVQNEIRLALSQSGSVMFRQNTGQAWTGNSMERLPGNSVLLHNARPVNFGLCKGSSDLIGWTPVVITPGMVGQTVAVFTAVEVKAGKGRPTPEQLLFIERLRLDGGLGGVAYSVPDALKIARKT